MVVIAMMVLIMGWHFFKSDRWAVTTEQPSIVQSSVMMSSVSFLSFLVTASIWLAQLSINHSMLFIQLMYE